MEDLDRHRMVFAFYGTVSAIYSLARVDDAFFNIIFSAMCFIIATWVDNEGAE